jgi:hypothetical protein
MSLSNAVINKRIEFHGSTLGRSAVGMRSAYLKGAIRKIVKKRRPKRRRSI